MQRTNPKSQFSIATLLLVTALIGVCLGLFRASSGLGVLSLLLGGPALLRTLSLIERERQYGEQLTALEKVIVYAGSLAVTVLVLIAGGVAGLVTSILATGVLWASLGVTGVMVIEPIVGGLAAIAAAGWMTRQTWPPREAFLAKLRRLSSVSPQENPEPPPHEPVHSAGK